MKKIKGGITAPSGFKANGLYCGIKHAKKKDLALIYSERLCDAAGVFTSNKVQASCVTLTKTHLKDSRAQAVVINSGNANCLTGKKGFENSCRMAQCIADQLRIKKQNVLVASTGVIGEPLPIKKIVKAVPSLVCDLNKQGSADAAAAILTTDRTVKEIAVEFKIGRRRVRLGAIAKGAGMIHPEMEPPNHATMLCFVATDADITQSALRDVLNHTVQKTFNAITVDADMSTNDMVLILANGFAQNKKITEKTPELRQFRRALEFVFTYLAKAMIADAEGATKSVEIVVKHALSREDARRVARCVASSNLVKCAVFGGDPNWGRIAAAVGYAKAHVDLWKLSIYLGKELVLKNGSRVKKKAAVLNPIFAKKNIKITVDLGLGKGAATALTCDLSTSYVRINSAYRT